MQSRALPQIMTNNQTQTWEAMLRKKQERMGIALWFLASSVFCAGSFTDRNGGRSHFTDPPVGNKSCRFSLKTHHPHLAGVLPYCRGLNLTRIIMISISKDCCDIKWKGNRPTIIIIITHPPTSRHCDLKEDARPAASNSFPSELLRKELTEIHSVLTSVPSKQQPLKNQAHHRTPPNQTKQKIFLERAAAVISRMRKGGRWPRLLR